MKNDIGLILGLIILAIVAAAYFLLWQSHRRAQPDRIIIPLPRIEPAKPCPGPFCPRE